MSKNRVFMALIASSFLFFSCEKEQQNSDATGKLHLELEADSKIDNAMSRAGNELLPEIGDFSLSILKGENVQASWDKFSQFPDELILPVGNYVAKAHYGDITKEGFELPYYAGSNEFAITDGGKTNVGVTCYLANAKLSIAYTESFVNYFKTYSAEVNSYGNTPIVFTSNETRSAYFNPSQISIYLNVAKQEGNTVKLFARSIQAQPRHAYQVTLDVNAGSSTLIVSFDDSVTEETVEIDVSDESLSADPPILKAFGFETGVVQDVTEGSKLSDVRAYINARSGISKCVLKTSSSALISQGWPAEIDLVSATAEEKAVLAKFGLKTIGLDANIENIAVVNFTEVIPFLEYNAENSLSTFTLEVSDKYLRTNEGEFSLKINSTDNLLAIGNINAIAIGATTAEIPVVFIGNPQQALTVECLSFGQYQSVPFTIKESVENNHVLVAEFPKAALDDMSIRVSCGRKNYTSIVKLLPPVYEVKALSSGDVWSNKAILTIVGENEMTNTYLANKDIVVSCALNGTDEWLTPSQTRSGNKIEITNIATTYTEAVTYSIKAICTINSIQTETSTVNNITTEQKRQLPNASFETWTYTSGNKDYWRKYYPWNDDVTTHGWNTVNLTTTQTNGSYQYNSISGTMETTGRIDNTKAAVVRTVGWGNANTAGGGASICYNGTPGELYLGSYNESTHSPIYGIEFTSRPKSISFYYKYTPSSGDACIVETIVQNRNGEAITELGKGRFTNGNTISSYTLETVNIDYTNTTLAPTHICILFKSGTNTDSWLEKPPFANLSTGKFVGSQLYVDDVTLNY